jgi:hypothetical protein
MEPREFLGRSVRPHAYPGIKVFLPFLMVRNKSLLGIRDILVRIPTADQRIRIRLLSSVTIRMQFFSNFFLSLNIRHIIFSLKKLNFLLKFCVKILLCKHYFSPLNAFRRKGKDPDPDLYPKHWTKQKRLK